MKFAPDHVEKLARQWAVLEGKGDLFDKCKADRAVENYYGHYEGYLADTYCLLGDRPDLQEITPEVLKNQWQ